MLRSERRLRLVTNCAKDSGVGCQTEPASRPKASFTLCSGHKRCNRQLCPQSTECGKGHAPSDVCCNNTTRDVKDFVRRSAHRLLMNALASSMRQLRCARCALLACLESRTASARKGCAQSEMSAAGLADCHLVGVDSACTPCTLCDPSAQHSHKCVG
jgi:hypothetical protein